MGKNQYVAPHPKGGWQVKGQENSRATIHTKTQKQAQEIGREIAIHQKSELVVSGKDGKFRGRNSYGNDPYLPKG
jgi:hypothetical protein